MCGEHDPHPVAQPGRNRRLRRPDRCRSARRGRPHNACVDVASLPGAAPQHLEYNAYEMVVGGPTMGVVRWASDAGYDAMVIGCFYDPGLRGAHGRSPVT